MTHFLERHLIVAHPKAVFVLWLLIQLSIELVRLLLLPPLRVSLQLLLYLTALCGFALTVGALQGDVR